MPLSLGNCNIPKGTSVLISIFNIHRNEQYWNNPFKFDPDETPELHLKI